MAGTTPQRKRPWVRVLLWAIGIELVPYGRSSHSNPPATDPFSWLTQRDVDQGRANLNFSEFTGAPDADEVRRVVEEGEMPPFQYTLIHPGAKLTEAEKQTLIAGYAAGLTASGSSGDGEPAPEQSATPTASAIAGADAVAIIEQECSTCHTADRAIAFRAGSEADAQSLIEDMKQRGAQVTAEQQQVLVGYFTQ